MIIGKGAPLVPSGAMDSLVISAVVLLFHTNNVLAFNPLARSERNCSQLCLCSEHPLDSLVKQYNNRHFAHMGEKYRSASGIYDTSAEYLAFLGIFASMMHRMSVVACELADGRPHTVTSLLNGVDDIMYTSLEVKCTRREELIWDLPTWHTSFNIFISDQCNIVPAIPSKGIILPMNLWIVDINKGGKSFFDELDLRFTMNTVTFSVVGSRTAMIPKGWKDKYMLSTSFLNLKDNEMETFDCSLKFVKRLDTLILEGNKLSRFPECILNPKNMQLNYLSLSNNQISDLTPIYEAPENAKVPDIKIINLSHNQVRNLEAIRDMGSLAILDLSNNALKEITGDAFAKLINLERLHLGSNKIQFVGTYAFNRNTKLTYLDLSHNNLMLMRTEHLPAGTTPLELDVRHNKLSYPPFRDCATNQLHNLNVKVYSVGNPFYCDCYMIDFERCAQWLDSQPSNTTNAERVFVDMNDAKCMAPLVTKDKPIKGGSFIEKCIITDNCPVGCACTLQNVENLVVNCSARRLLEMPDTFPSYPNASVALYLDHNPLQMLSYRAYLHGLSELHLDNCLLTSVTPAAIAALQNIKVMTLHNNLLQKLPSSTRNITLNNAKNVTLHNNRWACSCDSLWLPRWLAKHKASLWMPGNIVCNYLRKPVEDLSEADLNCNSSSYVDTFLAISLALSSIVSTLVIVFCYRSEINVLLYSKLGLRLGYNFSYGDNFNPYDAFVSYSQDNYRWVVDTLVPHLEDGPRKYRLCLHYRDFPAGEPVVDNIPWAIRLSRCSILVLSKDFLKKEWCIMEVRAAFQRLLLVANRLIVIATDDINVDELSPELRAYMNTHDYLKVGEPCFWEKLEMFLPPKPVLLPDAEQDVSSRMLDRGGDGDSMLGAATSEDKYPLLSVDEMTSDGAHGESATNPSEMN